MIWAVPLLNTPRLYSGLAGIPEENLRLKSGTDVTTRPRSAIPRQCVAINSCDVADRKVVNESLFTGLRRKFGPRDRNNHLKAPPNFDDPGQPLTTIDNERLDREFSTQTANP